MGLRGRNKFRRSWKRRLLITFNSVLALLIVVGISGTGYAQWRFSQVTKLNLNAVLDKDLGPKEPMNVLLVGSDSRQDLAPGEAKSFGSTKDVGGQRSDTIMLLHVDPKTQQAAILSIPRDLWIPIAGTGGKQRINTAFDKGPDRLIQTIKQNFNIPIDHYAEVNFDGFKGIVEAIGGVTIRFDAPARDLLSGLDVPSAGCISLTGDQALGYVRSRHYEAKEGGVWRADPRSDFSRIDRQQDFVRRVMRKAVDKASTNPLTLNSLISSAVSNVTVDSGFSLSDMTSLAKRFRSLDPSKVQMMTLPNTGTVINGADVLLPKQPDVNQTINLFLHGAQPQTGNATPPAIPSGSISVRVLNGSGVSGQATDTAGHLKDAGFVVSGLGDAKSAAVTTIRYATNGKDKADVIAQYIQGETQLVQDPTLRGVDAVITTGTSFQGVNVPGGSATTSSTTAAPANAVTTTTKPSPFVPAADSSC